MKYKRKYTRLPDIDDVSSESSLDDEEEEKLFQSGVKNMDQYLQDYYNTAYNIFE
jgi:hypothetical protein